MLVLEIYNETRFPKKLNTGKFLRYWTSTRNESFKVMVFTLRLLPNIKYRTYKGESGKHDSFRDIFKVLANMYDAIKNETI